MGRQMWLARFPIENIVKHDCSLPLPQNHKALCLLVFFTRKKNKPTSQTRRAVPIIEVYPYSITNLMFLLLTVSLL